MMEAKLASTHLFGQDVRALLRSESWNALNSRKTQLVSLNKFARTDCAVALDTGHLADVFALTRDGLPKVLEKSKIPPRPRYRLLSVTQDQDQILCTFIREGSDTGNSVTPREVLNFIDEEFHNTLTY
jgi:hypothetical protein